MAQRNILIVAVDGLRASALGAYGNTSYATPALDRFAAEGLVFDACFAPSVEPKPIYRALWQSRHPLRADQQRGPDSVAGEALPKTPWLARIFSDWGYRTTLVADDSEVAELAGTAGFGECVHVLESGDDPTARQTRNMDDPSSLAPTSLARLFAAASDVIAPPEAASDDATNVHGKYPPHLVWVHSRGMYGAWDAPTRLQASLREEGDPASMAVGASPDIERVDNPDTLFGYGCAYAAQVMVLDACWNGLVEALRANGGDQEWLVMLLGIRGFPLGEHGRVGGSDFRLYAEQLHVPWIIRSPDAGIRLARVGQLITHLDVLPTLAALVGIECQGSAAFDGLSLTPLFNASIPHWRDAVLSVSSSGNRSVRTSSWSLCQRRSDSSAVADDGELFVRPDDRCEANDVAVLCPDIVSGLAAVSNKIAGQIGHGEPMPAVELPAELRGAAE